MFKDEQENDLQLTGRPTDSKILDQWWCDWIG